MMERQTYAEKLKDPRWQKLRLEILNRDDWTCQKCYSVEDTLHVHHIVYEHGKEPWDYPLEDLITTCEDCHESEKDNKQIERQLINEIKRKLLFTGNLHELYMAFYRMKMPHTHDVTTSVLCDLLEDETRMISLVDEYFLSLKKRKECNGKTNKTGN